jgi:hypothetical protein
LPIIQQALKNFSVGEYDINNGSNIFYKPFLKKEMDVYYSEIKQVDKKEAKEAISDIYSFNSVHEKYFVNKSALHFCHLNSMYDKHDGFI